VAVRRTLDTLERLERYWVFPGKHTCRDLRALVGQGRHRHCADDRQSTRGLVEWERVNAGVRSFSARTVQNHVIHIYGVAVKTTQLHS